MIQKQSWKIVSIVILLAVLATGIWACSSTAQQTSAPASQPGTANAGRDGYTSSGEITVDLTDLTKTTLSAIQIDASDLTTDSERRDGAMQRFVLQSNSEEYRYIIFTPTAIAGVPNTASAGETIELQITGDLTISGVTKPVTFATTVTVASDSQINGLATAQVLRSDYNLTIPSVPSVANVTDEVQLQFQFIANAS